MPHARLVASALTALSTSLVAIPAARAQDAGAPKSRRAFDSGRGVDVTVIAGGEDAQPLVMTIREVVGRLGLPVTAHVVLEAPEAGEGTQVQRLARVEINLTSPGGDQVVVYGKDGQLALSRRFRRDASGSVLREEMADAVRSAVEAQLLTDPERKRAEADRTGGRATGGPIDVSPTAGLPPSVAEPPVAEPPPLPPAPPVPPVPPATAAVEAPRGEAPIAPAAPAQGLALDVTAFGGVGGFAWTTSVVSHVGGQAALAYRKWRNLSLVITGEYVPQFDASYTATATTSVASLRIGPAAQVFRIHDIVIDAGALAGIDVLNVKLSQYDKTKYAPTPQTIMDPILRGLVTVSVGLAPRVVLSLTGAYDFDLAAPFPRYVLGEQRNAVLAPWRARPVAFVGLTFAALGEARFASGILR